MSINGASSDFFSVPAVLFIYYIRLDGAGDRILSTSTLISVSSNGLKGSFAALPTSFIGRSASYAALDFPYLPLSFLCRPPNLLYWLQHHCSRVRCKCACSLWSCVFKAPIVRTRCCIPQTNGSYGVAVCGSSDSKLHYSYWWYNITELTVWTEVYVEDLKKPRKTYELTHVELNDRGSYVYPMRDRRLCQADLVDLVGLSKENAIRYTR